MLSIDSFLLELGAAPDDELDSYGRVSSPVDKVRSLKIVEVDEAGLRT